MNDSTTDLTTVPAVTIAAPLADAPAQAGPTTAAPAIQEALPPEPIAESAGESTPEVQAALAPAPVLVYGKPQGPWQVLEEAVVGLAHRSKNLPCQDAAQAIALPRPVIVVADGAGSSAVSEIGARAVVRATVRLLDTLDKWLAEWLDADTLPVGENERKLGLLLVKHAVGILKDLAEEHRRPVRDLRCTFLLMVMGSKRLLWLKVGDGALVLEKMRWLAENQGHAQAWQSELCTLGELGKGEFANETQFLDSATPQDVQMGWVDACDVCGMAVMSDGAAERLVANDGQRVATRISTLLQQLRQDKLKRQSLTQMFYEPDFCHASSGDDRSIALAACAVQPPSLPLPLTVPEASTRTTPPAPVATKTAALLTVPIRVKKYRGQVRQRR